MTDFTIITANDIHISDHPPRNRMDDYQEAILSKISQMCMICSKLGADAAAIAGDLFNIKEPAKNSHDLNRALVEEFKKFACPIYMIEGNHDLTGNRLESIKEQPLGVLFADKTLIQLREAVLEKNGVKISLVGVPYIPDLDLAALKLPSKEGFVSQVCLMHLYAGIKAGKMFSERMYGYDELAKLSPDVFVIGHYHIDQGIYENEGKYFVNIGSMSRGTLSEEDINHSPQIGFIKISVDAHGNPEYKLKSVRLKVRPANEIFDIVKKQEEQKENKAIQAFVEKLATEAVSSAISSKESIETIIGSMDIAKTIKDRATQYLQQAMTVNK